MEWKSSKGKLVAFSQVQLEQSEGWLVPGEVPGLVATTEITVGTDEGLIPTSHSVTLVLTLPYR